MQEAPANPEPIYGRIYRNWRSTYWPHLLAISFRTIYNHGALEKIHQLIVALESIECVLDHFKDPDKINHMRKEFDDALNLSNQLPVCFRKPILGKHRLHLIMNCISSRILIVHLTAINSLPSVDDSSWSSSCVCLPETQVNLLEDIWESVMTANNAVDARIFWLVGMVCAALSRSAVISMASLRRLSSLI